MGRCQGRFVILEQLNIQVYLPFLVSYCTSTDYFDLAPHCWGHALCVYVHTAGAMQRLQSGINSRFFHQCKQFDYTPKGIIILYEIPLARRKMSPPALRPEVV